MKKQNVEFKVGKDTLRGSIFIPRGKGPFPAVIFLHGSESRGETYFELAEKLSQNGILGFAFNYRGCGISDGNIKEQTLGMGLEDVKAALELFFSWKEVDKKRIGVSGSSYGAFLASMISSEYNFKSMVLIVPASYARSSMNIIHGTHIRTPDDFNKSDSYQEIEKFQGSVLVIGAEFEDVLPTGMAEKYFEVAKSAKRKEDYLLKGAKHRIKLNPKAKEVMIKKVINWFLETL
jgi:esterase/lipase